AGCDGERPRVVGGDRLERALEQEGGDDSECGRNDDQQENAAEPELVRREERPDAAKVRPADGRILGALGSPVGGVEEHAHSRSGYAAGSDLRRARSGSATIAVCLSSKSTRPAASRALTCTR